MMDSHSTTSSSKAGNDIDSRPSDETSQTVDKYDVNSTDSIIEPLPDVVSDASDQVAFDDETAVDIRIDHVLEKSEEFDYKEVEENKYFFLSPAPRN